MTVMDTENVLMESVYVILDTKEKTVNKPKDVMNNVTSMENVLKENAFVSLDGLVITVRSKFVQIAVQAMEYARTGDVYVKLDGKVLIVLSDNAINHA